MNPNKGFFLYARVTVVYDGRAKSVIGPSNLCVLHKLDGSLIVHGAVNCTPINYQRPRAILTVENGQLVCRSKKGDEEIRITIHETFNYYELNEWSSDKLTMTGTERQLCDYFVENASNILKVEVARVDREVRVEYGSIDILVTDTSKVRHIVEVKRAKASVNGVFQLRKYCDLMSQTHTCFGYLAAPAISDKALVLVSALGFKYVNLQPV